MQRLIRSRTGWLAIALLVVMAAFVLRLFQLQILQYGKYTELARASQQRQFVIPAERGKIYMMDGKTPVPVVLNQAVYTVIADPQSIDDKERNQLVDSLREIAGGEMTEIYLKDLIIKKSRYEVLAKKYYQNSSGKN